MLYQIKYNIHLKQRATCFIFLLFSYSLDNSEEEKEEEAGTIIRLGWLDVKLEVAALCGVI